MKIEMIETEKLIPFARNAKKHSESQIAGIAESIKEFKFNNPVLIDNDLGIIAGHGRVLAAQKLSMKEIPCIKLGHLTDNQKRAYVIADNKLSETGGGWDDKMLKSEIEDLKDFDFSSFGFDVNAVLEVKSFLKNIDIKPPPSIAWFLIGVPVLKLDKIQTHIDAIAKNEDVIMESSTGDKPDED